MGTENNVSRVEVVITEGRNRQVRRMFESINRDVIFLKRTAIGDIKLGGLYRGNFRELKENEIEYLKTSDFYSVRKSGLMQRIAQSCL